MRVAPVIRQGNFEGMVAVFRDITKDVEVDRLKSEFVSMVSHELRTPMTSIKGYIDLLHSGMTGPINDTQKQFLQTVKDNTDRLTVLLNDLLEINRLDTGELNLALESVDSVDVANQVIADLAPRAAQKHHQLSITAPTVLPAVRADPVRLAQILTNLVSNAINYTPDGGRIALDAKVEGDLLHMHVIDNGIGIPVQDQDKVFSRFYRADHPLVQAHSGTGLGLFIVRSLVQLHGGEMWFETQEGHGSTFSFSLPLARAGDEVSPRREFKTISYRSADKHILVVEDDVDAANLIAHQLRSRGGYRVHVARYGRDALDYLLDSTHHVDLVTLDLRLPDIPGLEVLQQIKAHESLAFIPVVIISILSEERESHRLGARAYLSKPIEEGRLLATIDGILAETATVLVAEDDPLQAEVLQMALEDRGFQVFTEHDGREVIKQVRTHHPGLVLLDIKLPGIDGYSILSTLKSAPDTRTIPVIVITGSVSDPEKKRQQVLGLGAVELFTKPLNLENLVGEIQQALAEGVSEPQSRPSLPPQPTRTGTSAVDSVVRT
jgi:CheY-like chemotaxis protein/two-component sensor histidine kinase